MKKLFPRMMFHKDGRQEIASDESSAAEKRNCGFGFFDEIHAKTYREHMADWPSKAEQKLAETEVTSNADGESGCEEEHEALKNEPKKRGRKAKA